MSAPRKILVAGRTAAAVRALAARLANQPALTVKARVMSNGHANVLDGLSFVPDAVVLSCSDGELTELAALAALPPATRPSLIVCGTLSTPQATRLAVLCGATDLLAALPETTELLEALARIAPAARLNVVRRDPGTVISVVGAAGGVGASFIASCLAHMAVATDSQSAVLVDLDTSYAPLATYLGVKSERGLIEALERVETLDSVALAGYLARSRSGTALLAATNVGGYLESTPLSADRFHHLLELLVADFDRVVVDVPRWLDSTATLALSESRFVVLVLEQSVANVHNASRLYRALTRQLGLPRDRIVVVLNRYSKRSSIDAAAIEKVLGVAAIEVPSDYEHIRDSLDTAVPFAQASGSSSVATALRAVNQRVGGSEAPSASGIFRRVLPLLGRGSA